MTFGELRELVNTNCNKKNQNLEVVLANGSYCYSLDAIDTSKYGMKSIWGDDYKVVIVLSHGQLGKICYRNEIEVEKENEND